MFKYLTTMGSVVLFLSSAGFAMEDESEVWVFKGNFVSPLKLMAA